jgi:AcrR family transcriptional regulator
MTTQSRHQAAAPTRRERQRAATYDEIVTVSRRLLDSPDALSLRAIASEMGMTAPALYRYVDSYNELLMLVARAIFKDVISAMTSARDRHGDDDPAAQIIASSVAFRGWALTHPAEFGLIFANLATAGTAGTAGTAETAGTAKRANLSSPGRGALFSEFFTDIFLRLWDRYRFVVPADSDLEPALLEGLREQRASGTLPCDFPGHPLGLAWIFIRCWARLYGTVTLEVFKQMDRGVIESGALFREMLEDNGRDLGFGDDWPRLRALSRLETTRSVRVSEIP